MAVDLTPDDTDGLWAAIAPHLPARPKDHNPKGGRPPADDRAGRRGILDLLREGCRWQRIPSAARNRPSGRTCWRRSRAWTRAGVWAEAHLRRLDLLGEAGVLNLERVVVDSASVRAEQGGRTPAPTRPTGARAVARGTA